MRLSPRWKSFSLALMAPALGVLGVICATRVHIGTAPRFDRLGVVVEVVGEDSALEGAGLRPGDIVTSWERLPSPPAHLARAEGRIESVFDWEWLRIEQSPRGTLRLFGERDGKEITLEVALGTWDAQVRPRMSELTLQSYLHGQSLKEAGNFEAGISSWNDIVQSIAADSDFRLRCWMNLRIAESWVEKRRWGEAHVAYRSALEDAREAMSRVLVWKAWGNAYERQNEFEQAEEAYRSALEMSNRAWGRSLILAGGMSDIGRLAWRQRSLKLDFNTAEEYFKRTRDILEQLAPDSLEMAANRIDLGLLTRAYGDFSSAEKTFEQALALAEKLAPDSLDVAAGLVAVGSIAFRRGRLEKAEEYVERALEIRQRRAPDSLLVSESLNFLGEIAEARSHLRQAEEHLARALEIAESQAPDTLDVAIVLSTRGSLARVSGRYELAEEYWMRSLEILQRRCPDSRWMVALLEWLGLLAFERHDLDLAEDYYTRELALLEKLNPGGWRGEGTLHKLGLLGEARGDLDSAEKFFERAMKADYVRELEQADVLESLARVAGARGRWESAEEYARRSLEIRETLAPNSLDESSSRRTLGQIALARGELELAGKHFEDALKITRKVAPDTGGHAGNLHDLAMVYREKNQPEKAAELSADAIEVLEGTVRRLGSSYNVKAGYRARYSQYYRHYVELLLEEKRFKDAFAVLERSRAASFLALLAERNLIGSDDVPEDLEKARRDLATQYDQIQHQRTALDPEEDRDQFVALSSKLRELELNRDNVNKEIVKESRTSLQVAALQDLESLDLGSTQRILDPGTVMLFYSVGDERTDVFVVTRGPGVWVETLPLGKEKLRQEVTELRDLLAKSRPGWPYMKDLRELARHLYSTLIEPVADRVREAERLLIIPDGSLHVLPFGALIREPTEDGEPAHQGGQYLVEWKPLHTVLSATVYAELKKSRPVSPSVSPPGGPTLAAFGDPYYPPKLRQAGALDVADAVVRSAARRGFDFRPLPATRREVEEIAGLYSGSARAYLGREALEERAKVIGRDTRYLHFASHGFFDEQFPLNSGLALAIPEELRPGRENGLLQAWEIIEQMRLGCELAVLSACASGLGKELGGDGLIGLTRAFQLAGARSVLASLWNVADVTTAELMVRFYRHLNDGMSKDEALQAAQIELIRAPIRLPDDRGRLVEVDARVPYYWAAFQLYGDWR